jgi:transposase-like protein
MMSIMESMGKKEPRRSLTPEFKAEIVELCRRGDRSVGQVAKDFDLTETAVCDWVKQAEVDAGERLTSSEREGRGDPQAGHCLLLEGDPVTVHPFIEAEKTAAHSVKRACELLKVSRAAFYAHPAGAPGPRAVHDAELTQQIIVIHERSRGTYGAPRVHAVLKRDGAGCGRRGVARLIRLAGRHRRRPHRTTIPDPAASTRPDLVLRDFRPNPGAFDTRRCDAGPASPTPHRHRAAGLLRRPAQPLATGHKRKHQSSRSTRGSVGPSRPAVTSPMSRPR